MKLGEFLLLYVVVALISMVWTMTADYCSPYLCHGMGYHIGCRTCNNFGPACSDDANLVDMNEKLQSVALGEFNKYRNLIAGGGDKNHSPACRMATMQWDQELADLAALNVKRCSFTHDQCHNTDTFHQSGQNLALAYLYGPQDTSEKSIITGIKMWYGEVSLSNMRNIRKSPNGPGNIGHFVTMIVDKNIRVGCAASNYSRAGFPYRTFEFACNFASIYMPDKPVYTDCPRAATGCTTGNNGIYPNLCSPAEPYDVNWF